MYWSKRPCREGSKLLVFEPLVLIEPLAALVPRPHRILVTYYGVFGASRLAVTRLQSPLLTGLVTTAPRSDQLPTVTSTAYLPAGAERRRGYGRRGAAGGTAASHPDLCRGLIVGHRQVDAQPAGTGRLASQ